MDTVAQTPAASNAAPAPASAPAKPAPVAARKPRPQPARNARVVEPATPDTDFWWCLAIDIVTSTKRHTRTETTTYLVCEVPAEGMGRGCRGFMLEKLDAALMTVEVYNTLLRPGADGSCTCLGHEAHGHCKHRSALAALRAAGKLPAPAFRSAGDFAAHDPAGHRAHETRVGRAFTSDPREYAYGDEGEHCQASEHGDAWEGPEPDRAA